MGTRSSELCLSCHERIRPEMWQKQVAGAHPLNPPLTTVARQKAIGDMGTQIGPNDTMICLSCHKLHKGLPDQHLLADTLQDSRLCLRCHEDRKSLAGSPHDLRKSAPTEKNALGLTPVQSGQCGACHTFHTYMRPPVASAADPDGRCMTCHAEGKVAQKAGGAAFGHPVVLANKDLPRALALRLNPGPGHEDNRTLECLTCHNPHETKQPKFLRTGRDALCGTCHGDKLQSLAADHDFTSNTLLHNGLGKTASETGKCGFCHDVHHGNGPDLWTATNAKPASPDDLCIQCHRSGGLAAKKPAFSYSHPTGPGSTRTTGAAISLPLFDESAHRSATGFVACASCHDPHVSKQTSKALLRVGGTTSELCLKCHGDKQSLVSGPHDQSRAMKPWPARAKADTDANSACMGCHRPHGNNPVNQLWAVAPAASSVAGDGVCIACHQERHWSSEGSLGEGNMIHPRILDDSSSAANAARTSGLPLGFDQFAASRNSTMMPPRVLGPPAPLELTRMSPDTAAHTIPNAIACKTCHDPHTGRNSLHLLRVARGKGPEDVCLNCHKDVSPLAHGMHRLDNPAIDALVPLPTKGEASASDLVAGSPPEHPVTGPPAPRSLFGPACAPCHAVHAIETSERKLLWAAPRSRAGANESDQRCLGCHGPGGGAKKPEIFEHPAAAFASLRYAAGANAPTDPVTLFSCSTCHLPHGQELSGVEKVAASSHGDAFIAAARPMVRDQVSQTICSVCHGADARRVFMYYHQPGQRGAAASLAAPR